MIFLGKVEPAVGLSIKCRYHGLFFLVFLGPHFCAYGGSQAIGPIRVAAAGLRQGHSNAGWIRAASVTYTTAHGNGRILNLLRETRERTHIPMDVVRFINR